MKIQARYVAVAIVMAIGLAVTTTGCGSDSGSTANITFRSEPAAEIWVDGTLKGSTPIVVALDKGSHDIKFHATGFEDTVSTIAVEPGKDLSVGAVLTVAGTGEAALAHVAKALGMEHAPFEKPGVHRGSSNKAIMLYWPQKKIRKEGLTSYRLDVTEDYEGDGFIVFKKGSKVLHREPLNPKSFEVVGIIPESVREAVKRGSKIKWGVEFESKRKRPVMASAQIVSGKKFEQRKAKLERRNFYKRQPDIIQEKMVNKVFQVSDLHSEGLVHALGMARRHPTSTMPFEDMITNARRLDLKDTPLWAEASQYVMGAGRGRTGGAGGPSAGGNTGGMGAGVGAAPGSGGGLPPVFAAPTGGQGGSGTGAFAASGPKTSGFSKKGMGPGDGVDVQPTPQNEKREPGPITDDPGVRVDPDADADAHQAAIDDLNRQIADAEETAQAAAEAEDRLRDATNEAQAAAAALSAAEAALAQVKADRDAGTATDADVQAAEQAAYDARQANDQAAAEMARTADLARQALEATGSKNEAQAALEELKRQLEALKGQTPPGTGQDPLNPGGTPQPGSDPASQLGQLQNALADAQSAAQQAIDDRNQLQQDISDAEARASDASLTDQERAAAARELAEAQARQDEVNRAAERAEQRVRDLEKQIKESGGD